MKIIDLDLYRLLEKSFGRKDIYPVLRNILESYGYKYSERLMNQSVAFWSIDGGAPYHIIASGKVVRIPRGRAAFRPLWID